MIKFIEQFVFRVVVFGNRVLLVLIILIIDEFLEFKCYDLDNKRDFLDMTQKVVLVDYGELEDVVVYLFIKKENEFGYRVFLVIIDYLVLLVQFFGRIMWFREEVFVEVIVVEVVELLFFFSQVNFEIFQEEFGVYLNGRLVGLGCVVFINLLVML